MVNKIEDVEKEEMFLENGKSVIQYIEQDGTPSTKFAATFMCEYIYNNEGVLVSHNIFNNPYYIDNTQEKHEEDKSKIRKINFYLSVDTMDKLNELSNENNRGKSEMITELIDNAFNNKHHI